VSLDIGDVPSGPDRVTLAARLRELAEHVEIGAVSGLALSGVGLMSGNHLFLDCSYEEARLLQHNLTALLFELSSALQSGPDSLPEVEVPLEAARS